MDEYVYINPEFHIEEPISTLFHELLKSLSYILTTKEAYE